MKKPLGLLVLDDPLQNLDELTVTTFARGLVKVTRLWDGSVQLLLLFHGRDDCERFLGEMPLAFYRLPWQSPEAGDSSQQVEITAEDPRPVLEGTQRLANLVG